MLNIGLASVTFKTLDFLTVIGYCKDCGIECIEWASNSHAPVSEIQTALKIRKECEKNNIKISSYGSYYRCGRDDGGESAFKEYIEIAEILGAPTIRIWVGEKNYEDADCEYVEKIVNELKLISVLAKEKNIQIGCEFHRGTLCNCKNNALDIVKNVNCDNFGMYFQYDPHVSMEENIDTITSFIPFLKNVHVFNISKEAKRFSLGEKGGVCMWEKFTDILKSKETDTNLLLEFLPEPGKDGLFREAKILKEIVGR